MIGKFNYSYRKPIFSIFIIISMGCVPDRTSATYRTFQNQEPYQKNQGQFNSVSRGSQLSLNSNDLNISYRPFAKVYRSAAKRTTNSPVKLAPQLRSQRRRPNYFSLQKTQWNNMEQQMVVVTKEQSKRTGKKPHVRGAIVQIPHRDHVITKVETPSQSAKTSFLSKMSKNPSNFFISNSENDLDRIFRSNLLEKPEESTASVKNLQAQESEVKEEEKV